MLHKLPQKKGDDKNGIISPEKISGIDVSEGYTRNTHLENVKIFGIFSECLSPQEKGKNFCMTQEGLQELHFCL